MCINVLLLTVGESVASREQEQFTQSEVMPAGEIIATDGKLNGGIAMRILM